jgi:hypothetical protein
LTIDVSALAPKIETLWLGVLGETSVMSDRVCHNEGCRFGDEYDAHQTEDVSWGDEKPTYSLYKDGTSYSTCDLCRARILFCKKVRQRLFQFDELGQWVNLCLSFGISRSIVYSHCIKDPCFLRDRGKTESVVNLRILFEITSERKYYEEAQAVALEIVGFKPEEIADYISKSAEQTTCYIDGHRKEREAGGAWGWNSKYSLCPASRYCKYTREMKQRPVLFAPLPHKREETTEEWSARITANALWCATPQPPGVYHIKDWGTKPDPFSTPSC